ncbi:beta-1,4-mannooligosaccharide/beta-1,4-mannosyl-N-acetylglucosamine phosphorylase [Paenibacillus anaericanus]|uniref:Glycosylase n=1 Tax=Paenibacillus anaericanus TaxID=170367 RepID=A0A433Y9G4_9BACL|nr:glycoside hydrolase family 130 protein [Paenibacillus anaericanus]MDQ0090297.1 beta-1,4-mannooligosaccharide/beta-1,4-mannosyl-N-acetylglucosamine phosphorylase [Paenibacillus anaericanus]RUT46535.1 glycosylase [Paenibacillus anaericanus]
MTEVKIIGENLPNMPWQNKPESAVGPVWRHSDNPVINRNPAKGIARIFNSAVAAYEDRFVGVFRAETINGRPHLHMGWSDDALNWKIEEERIEFVNEKGQPFQPNYAYDPRLVKVEGTYYIIWCTDFYGAAIGVAKTDDFRTFVRLDNPFLPFNRNGVLFPRKINDNFVMLSRPSDSGHTPFGDVFLSESPDFVYWGKHRHVMTKGGQGWWQSVKIGGGPAPIETTEGWLMFYHGVTGTCNGFVYSMGAVILDLEEPSKVKYRSSTYVLTPEEWYEERGFVNNVVFPCSTLFDAESGRIAIYYGAADTYVGVAYTTVQEIVDYVIETNEVVADDAEIGII